MLRAWRHLPPDRPSRYAEKSLDEALGIYWEHAVRDPNARRADIAMVLYNFGVLYLATRPDEAEKG
jgi:hypothetical protein